ncbi:hypothetical protein WH96_00520 [Kiloniella spongiae]|uniref:DUF3592 domain-containing protein n=1 Tax=Kiloniella spongiae TaxID=1489064 RepID=A0A0H2MI66_9PROT|nr:DUF3592 domain-containing protein [Kiloniella spongiae]KLN62063.1 hypothetical protein WH96_00520 [Kiloniella spongiae]
MKTIKILQYIFLCVGLITLSTTGIWSYTTLEFVNNARSTQGTVTDLIQSRSSSSSSTRNSYVYRPKVTFRTETGEDITFQSSTGSNPPAYARGENLNVLYDPENPQNAKISDTLSLWLGPIILGIIGFIFSVIGIGFSVYFYKKGKQKKYLLRYGTPVTAQIDSIIQNTNVRVNGKHPFQIIAQWQDPVSNTLHLFKSENIWFNPEPHIESDIITVLLNQAAPQKYYVDISFLPKTAE